MPTTALADASGAFLRESLAILVRNHGPEDIVQTLSEVIGDYAVTFATRTGDYSGAAEMYTVARYLDGLEAFLNNCDPAPP